MLTGDGGHKFHVYSRSEGIAGVIISDGEYPQLSAQKLLSKVVDEFLAKNPRSSWTNSNSTASLPELKEYMRTWQDPEKVDPIAMINKTLVETTNVARKNVESLIERGAKIEDLVAKSDDLSAQSKMFYRQAKKQNSCCAVM
jgi:synaptobrevin family protein YKT6